MKRIIRNNILFLVFLIMLNSLAVWALSFIGYTELIWIYAINLVPVALMIATIYMFLLLGKKNAGFIFLSFVVVKFLFFLLFLYLYDIKFGITRIFILNFVVVYAFLLFQSIFIVTKFLIKK